MKLIKGEIYLLEPYESFELGTPVAKLEDVHDITQATLTLEGFKKGDLIEMSLETIEAPTVKALKMMAVAVAMEDALAEGAKLTVGEWERVEAQANEEAYFLPIMDDRDPYGVRHNMTYIKLVVRN